MSRPFTRRGRRPPRCQSPPAVRAPRAARKSTPTSAEDFDEPLIDAIDHLVLTVRDLDRTLDFYTRRLGMTHREREGRHSLHFGEHKINLHPVGSAFEPRAAAPTPGSADLCFSTWWDIDRAATLLREAGVEIIDGPVKREGANGTMTSIYFRDPDQNLLELSRYDF